MPAYTGTGGKSRLVPPFSGTISRGEGLAEPRLQNRAEAYFSGNPDGGQVVGESDGEADDLHQLPRSVRRGGAVGKECREVEESRHVVSPAEQHVNVARDHERVRRTVLADGEAACAELPDIHARVVHAGGRAFRPVPRRAHHEQPALIGEGQQSAAQRRRGLTLIDRDQRLEPGQGGSGCRGRFEDAIRQAAAAQQVQNLLAGGFIGAGKIRNHADHAQRFEGAPRAALLEERDSRGNRLPGCQRFRVAPRQAAL